MWVKKFEIRTAAPKLTKDIIKQTAQPFKLLILTKQEKPELKDV